MVVDASAMIAILRGEPEEESFKRVLALATVRYMSPINWWEVAINAEKAGRSDMSAFDKFCKRLDLKIVPVDEGLMRLAHQSWRRYGKGQHPARLNLGDCFAYALAKSLNEPLLYKGGDFARTDVAAAV